MSRSIAERDSNLRNLISWLRSLGSDTLAEEIKAMMSMPIPEKSRLAGEIRPSEREAFIVMAHLLRDAARKARDSGLQADDDELDRLVRVVNAPTERVIEEVCRWVGPTRRPAVANPNGLMGTFYP